MVIELRDDKVDNIFRHPLVRGILDQTSDGVVAIDARSRRIMHINKRAKSLLGYFDADVLGCVCKQIARSSVCESSCPLTALVDSPETASSKLDVFYGGAGGTGVHARTQMILVRGPDGTALAGIEIFRDRAEVPRAKNPSKNRGSLGGIIGESPTMQELFSLVEQVAPYELPVLVTGESGVGKERVADALHALSDRAQQAFVKVNCAALSPSLVESELFGHRRGAFTGASQDRLGRFEEAHGGTIFLDEVGELPLGIQAKLLRALQEGEVQRVGEDRPRKVDVRVIAATNRDVEEDVSTGLMRQDLYYRLAGVRIHVPPLRERLADIPQLAAHFLERFQERARRRGRPKEVAGLSPEAEHWLLQQPWPGNVRELENALRLAYIRTPGGRAVELSALQQQVGPVREALPQTLAEIERRAIEQAVELEQGNLSAAARRLGIDRSTLWRKLKRLEAGGTEGA